MSQTEHENAGNATPGQAAVPAKVETPVVVHSVAPVRSGRGMAAVALLFSLTALGAAGFLFVQGQNVLAQQQTAFEHKLKDAALGESGNAALLAEAVRKADDSHAALTRLDEQLRQYQLEVQNNGRAVQEVLKRRSDWVVDETEAALNVAAQQLAVAENLPAAIAVLEGVDARLARFDQAALLPLKQAVSQDLAALKQMPFTDVSGNALRLSRLEMASGSLPLLLDSTLRPAQEGRHQATQTGVWWRDAWNKSVAGLKNMVEVRHLDHPDAMLLSAEQVFYVRENLRLRLLSARVALMQRQGEVYQQDLALAQQAVKQYFDGSSAAVQSWLREIEGLKALNMQSAQWQQSLAGSLAAVEAYRQTRGIEQLAAPVAASEPAAASAANASEAAGSASDTAAAASQPSSGSPRASEVVAAGEGVRS